MDARTFLYIAYYLLALLYFFSGILLIFRPGIIEHLIPKLFPLLAHFKLQRMNSAFNLIFVGCILFLTAEYLVEKVFIGFFIALVLSAWEVYLSVTFYLKHHTQFDVWSHFLVHMVIVILVGWLLLSGYEKQLNALQSTWMAIIEPNMVGPYFMSVFHKHILAVTFLVCLLGGEPAVLFFAFLSAQGELSPWSVVLVGITTALLGEIFWFACAKTDLFNFLDNKFFEIGNRDRLFARIKKVLDKSPLKMFFLARFISGITIPCIFYLSRKRLAWKMFLSYCLAINFFWAPIVTLVGWSSGRGFLLVSEIFKDIQITLNIVFGCGIIGYLLYKYLGRYIVQTSTKTKLVD